MLHETIIKRTYVGSLKCQREPLLLEGFKTLVISCEPVETKSKKNNTTKKYEVELQDTILFPEGGGQPSDSGSLRFKNDLEDVEVLVSHVSRAGLHAKHHIDYHIEPGKEVEVTVDATKRIDYMQQHTGQHLVSAILESNYNLKTLSWSMGGVTSEKKPVLEMNDYFNYIELERKLGAEEITELSNIIEKFIIINPQDISVVERTSDQHGDIATNKVPDDYDLEKGILRTIHIGSIDANPCCGTHLKSTAQIGSILILPNQTNVRGKNSRIYFMCGDRVARYGCAANEVLSKSKNILSCVEVEIPEKVEKMKDQIQKAGKREQFWMKELANFEVKRLLASLKEIKKAHLIKDEFGTLEFSLQIFKDLSSALAELPEYEIVLCGREKQSQGGSLIILSESGEKITKIASHLTSIIMNLKGGGGKKGGKWQGKIVQFTNAEYEAVSEYLETNF